MKLTKAVATTVAAVALMAGLAACTSNGAENNSGSGTATATAEPGALPTTIEHRYGETTIEQAPQRVVSLGYTDQDALLALGITPVSVKYWDGMAPEGQAAGNWANDKVTGEVPRIDKDSEVNAEAIAKDDPDLIIAVYSNIDRATYDKLSEIAPVVVQKGDYKELQQPWDVTTEEIGQAVGKPEEARKLIDGVKKQFTDLKDRHPEWSGTQLGVATTDGDNVAVFSSQDPRSRFFQALGFTTNPEYDAIAKDKFYGEVSKENADRINSDVLVWDQLSYSPKKDQTSITEDTILGRLPAVKDGHSVYLEGDMEKAFGWQTVLSLKYVLDNIEQPLAAATK